MDVCERLRWRGLVRVTVTGPAGVETVEFTNLITNAGRNLLSAALRGADAGIRYVAIGVGTTAPTVGQIKLVDERLRKPVTRAVPGVVGEAVTTLYLAPGDANTFTIREIGWFAGPSASATPNSGVLVARVLYTRTKNSLESIQVERRDNLIGA